MVKLTKNYEVSRFIICTETNPTQWRNTYTNTSESVQSDQFNVSPTLIFTQEDKKNYIYDPSTFSILHLLTQGDLSELVRDLSLSKKQTEVL